jgi:hypothetical protein
MGSGADANVLAFGAFDKAEPPQWASRQMLRLRHGFACASEMAGGLFLLPFSCFPPTFAKQLKLAHGAEKYEFACAF